ncbi:L-seryl-tRNA(Sec) selenium transferase [bacterium]|nr:L-seryl-tRNA(Sec) selenium transferase [bacterium]
MVSHPPSVDALATSLDDGSLPRSLLIQIARNAIETWRSGDAARPSPEDIGRAETRALTLARPGAVINATGVLLHTNLGRAVIGASATTALTVSAAGFEALEFDLESGTRGSRGLYARRLAATVCGADAALIVNNTAGALLLTVAALAGHGEVIVSRGELIEIGGSFRLPEVIAASGARLVEVGTTNRTRAADYEAAIGPNTGALLKVHPSNYRVDGFAEEATHAGVAEIGARHGIPVVADIGSGLLDARTPWLDGEPPAWLSEEPAARQTLEFGADIVMFSGDKLLGGPQAGIIAGRQDLISRIARHPIARATRIDGPRLAALAATLEAFASGRGSEIPFWKMATTPSAELAERCRLVAEPSGDLAQVGDGFSLPGAGSVPGSGIPGPMIVVAGRPAHVWRRLLDADPPIVTRREQRGVVVDLRAVDPAHDGHIAASLAAACRS